MKRIALVTVVVAISSIIAFLAFSYASWRYSKMRFNEALAGKPRTIDKLFAYKLESRVIEISQYTVEQLSNALKNAKDVTYEENLFQATGDDCDVKIEYRGAGWTHNVVYLLKNELSKLIITDPDGGSDFRYYMITVDEQAVKEIRETIDTLYRTAYPNPN